MRLSLSPIAVLAGLLVLGGCVGQRWEQITPDEYTFAPFKICLRGGGPGGTVRIRRFELATPPAKLTAASDSVLVPAESYPILRGLPRYGFGTPTARVPVEGVQLSFEAATQSTFEDLFARYIGNAMQNARVFEKVIVDANHATDAGNVAPAEADYSLACTVYKRTHWRFFEPGSASLLIRLMSGDNGGTWSWDFLDLEFQLFDRQGTRVLALPMQVRNSFGLDAKTTKTDKILNLEFAYLGLREAMAIAADYLIENIHRL